MNGVIAKLVVKEGLPGQDGREISLEGSETIIGRSKEVDVPIDSTFASRQHASITHTEGAYWLTDMNSKNGTMLNNKPITAAIQLTDGSEIRIGDIVLTFVDPAVTRVYAGTKATPPPIRIDPATREVWVKGQQVKPDLTVKQFDLLTYLYARAGEAVSKEQIATEVWKKEGVNDYQVDKMVSRLRESIGKEWVQTVWGYGYRLRLD